MCGIYGYIGKNAVEKAFEGIRRLEYRGYDSAGIAFINFQFKAKEKATAEQNVLSLSNGLSIIKAKGELKKLEGLLKEAKPSGDIAIAHTRWATHGKPSAQNSHPHYSHDKKWAVVHNGIIENYLELKSGLKTQNFTSDTDTEVIPNLLQEFYDGDILHSLKKVCDKLQGSFALGVIYSEEPDKIFVARRNSPVAVGYGKECGVVSSDLGSVEDAEKVFLLENDCFAVVSKGAAEIYDNNLKRAKLKNLASKDAEGKVSLGQYKHYMLKEIDEIPDAISRTVANYNTFDLLSMTLPKSFVKKIKNILIVGCGTAYHAGLIGKSLFEKERIKTETCLASELHYSDFVALPNTLAIFVSQSGETADTLKSVKFCKNLGLKTLAITNVKNSSICFEADYCLYTQAGAEIGVASTKAYDCQVVMFYLLAAYFKAVKEDAPHLVFEEGQKIIECALFIKNNENKTLCKQIAGKIKRAQSIFMLGRGVGYYIAMEASLKLKEISYIHCEAYAAGELKHGTISLIDSDKYVFAFITEEKLKEKMLSNVNEVVSRGGKTILLSQFEIAETDKFQLIKLPKVEERFEVLIALHYMQLIAYYTSVKLGFNPDKPRSLAKSVTVE